MLDTRVFLVLALGACSTESPATLDATLPPPPDGETECTSLGVPTAMAPVMRVAMAPPTPQGGAIVPGRYVITEVTDYTGPTGMTGATGQVFQAETVNDGTRFQLARRIVDGTGTADSHIAGTYTISGTSVVITDTCPQATSTTYTFDASPTQFMLYLLVPGPHTMAYRFVKQ